MQEPAADSCFEGWQIALRRPAGAAGWQVDLLGPRGCRHFESLAPLIRWLEKLDSPEPTQAPSGIR
jgi:hypothetical protein